MNHESNRLTWKECKKTFPDFLENVLAFAKDQELDVEDLCIDHAGLRLKGRDDVDSLRKEIEEVSVHNAPVSSVLVNGREICIFELEEPLTHNGLHIGHVELPYPKVPHNYPIDGWEHLEFVLPSSAITIKEFEKVFNNRFPHIRNYRTDMPVGPVDQRPNPSIVLQKEKSLRIKFHPLSIAEVIARS